MNEYAQGGYVGSPGDESISFVIHPGESWVSAEVARRYGIEALRKLNGGGEVHVSDDDEDKE